MEAKRSPGRTSASMASRCLSPCGASEGGEFGGVVEESGEKRGNRKNSPKCTKRVTESGTEGRESCGIGSLNILKVGDLHVRSCSREATSRGGSVLWKTVEIRVPGGWKRW